jgi:ATP-binding cassette subfamily C (CFTR/MRP) protein 1
MKFSRAAIAVSNSSSTIHLQPFCHNYEGWGPLSAIRYDFTPCFVDVPQAAVALFGLVVGAATIWWLVTKTSKQPTEKNWHYFSKLVNT